MAILRPTWQDITTEHNVQTWQDWPWDTWLGPYIVISPRRYRVRVRVYRAGEWVDITSRVASGVIRESNDQPVATLELRLLNGREYPSLAPRRKDSPLNRVDGQYVPLLWIGRPIAVEAAFSEDGSEPDEWWPVFLGELEDEIDTENGPDGTYVRLFCRDMATRLQRAYIAGPWAFENMYASQMIQAILDRAYSEGLIQEPVQLRLVGPDDFWVERYDIEYTDLWSALQRFCQQRGTDLRYRLNEAPGQIELTYWLPDRSMVPGWIIDASQVRREELRISGTDIINRVTVRYRDAQTGQRAEVMVQDADSIAMYGLRHGLIEEPDTDLIPDQETAQKLAQTIVDDLRDVPALTRLTVPFDPRIQLFDKLRVANPNVRDEPEDYAIEGRELSFSATDWSMVLIGGGRVVVKRQVWLERMATEGVKRPFTPRDTTTSVIPPAPTIIEAKSVPGGVQLTLAPPLGLYWNGFVIHASKTPNFTPGPETEVVWGSETRFSILGLDPGEMYYFRAQSMDFARNRSAPSNEVSAQAGQLTPDGRTVVMGNALVTTDGDGNERIATGDISGRPWGDDVLPPGTYGIWGDSAALYLQGYAHNIRAGYAEDGDRVLLEGYKTTPRIILVPANIQVFSPSRQDKIQRIIIEARDVSREGFNVYAKLVDATGTRVRHTFPTKEHTWDGPGSHTCGTYSAEVIQSAGQYKRYTTQGDKVTEAAISVRRMMHVTAPAGNHDRYQSISWRVRIREAGASSWLRTFGPFSDRIAARSSTFTRSTNTKHSADVYTFENLPPGQYEIEVEITSKSWNSGQYQNDAACWLVIDWWEERTFEEIVLPYPNRVAWIALEAES